MESRLGEEPHRITGSSLIFLPSDLPHTIRILRVDPPIFHFFRGDGRQVQ